MRNSLVVLLLLLAVNTASAVEPEQLTQAMLAWQPYKEHDITTVREVATGIVQGCRTQSAWPNQEQCPTLVAALTFRESSWKPAAVGGRGEVGLMQLMPGIAFGGFPREALFHPRTNIIAGLMWLHTSEEVCRHAGWGRHSNLTERTLGMYGGVGCVPNRPARKVLLWARVLDALMGNL